MYNSAMLKENQPFILGIAGGSCSGKTTVAEALFNKHQGVSSFVMFDDYFVDTGDIDPSTIDWESIDRYDIGKLKDDLARLKAGEVVVYASNSRESSEVGVTNKTIEPKPLIIIEGFLLFADPEVRNHLNLMIFLDIPEEEIVKRRLDRKKDDSPWDAEEYIYGGLLKGHREYVLPTKVFAHYVIDATKSPTEVVEEIDQLIHSVVALTPED